MNKLIILVVSWICIRCENSKPDIGSKFHGMWKLERFEYLETTSKWLPDTMRNGYTGYIVYDAFNILYFSIPTVVVDYLY